jgi:HK97 family phage major capsid protein
MSAKIRSLLEQRNKKVEAIRAILDEADTQTGGVLSQEQHTRISALEKEEIELSSSVEAEQRNIEREKRGKIPVDGGGLVRPIGSAAARAESSGPTFGTADGRQVRGLLAKDKLFDSLGSNQRQDLSLTRTLRGLILGDWTGAEEEHRALGSLSGTTGGFLVPTPLSATVIDLARNKSVVLDAGAITIPMESSELTIVKVAGDPRGYWRPEHASITESDPTFEPVNLKAVSLGCLVRISIELLEDATNLSDIVERTIAEALAIELDRVALLGSGVGEPRGLANTPSLASLSLGTNGATPTNYDKFSEAVEAVQTANGSPSVVVFSPRTQGTLDRLKDTTGQPLQAPESFKNLRKLVSNQIPTDLVQGTATNASLALVGDFTQLAIGMRTQLILEASRVSGDAFEKMDVLIRGYLRADIAVMRPSHFAKILGIKA